MNKALVAGFGMLFVLGMLGAPAAHASFLDDLRIQLGALRIQLDELIQKSEMLKAPSASPSTPYSNTASTGSIIRSPSASFPQSGRFIVLEELPDSPQVACALPELSARERKDGVYLLQMALHKAGYYKDGFITGYYGKLTEAAVKRFQSERGLPPTGRLDRASAAALDAYIKEYFEECRSEKDARPIIELPYMPATSSPFEPPLPPITLPPYGTSTKPSITVTHPLAGYLLDNSGGKDSGLIANIQWKSEHLGGYGININLLGKSGTARTIAYDIQDTGSYAWKYDTSIPDGTYQIQIVSSEKGGPAAVAYSGYFSLSGNSPQPATSTPPIATSTRPHGPSVWNYGWDDFTSPLGADHAAQILENYKAHPEEYGVNPIGNNGYIPNPALYGTSSLSMPSAVLRLYKACGDHWINRKEYIPVVSGGYMNYRCTNRYKQQCIEDGSFDSYYDEACIYENASPSASSGADLYSASVLNAAKNELNYMVGQLKSLLGEGR